MDRSATHLKLRDPNEGLLYDRAPEQLEAGEVGTRSSVLSQRVESYLSDPTSQEVQEVQLSIAFWNTSTITNSK